MKGGRRTAKGVIINIDDLIASSPSTTAVGNMGINAQGDKLGRGGGIEQTREQRTRAYYKDHPQASNRKVSLKGEMKSAFETDTIGMEPKTSKTGMENVKATQDGVEMSEIDDAPPMTPEEIDRYRSEQESAEPLIPEPQEFEAEMPPTDPEEFEVEPDGYEEVHLPNGDIEMKPYWNAPKEDDNGSGLA